MIENVFMAALRRLLSQKSRMLRGVTRAPIVESTMRKKEVAYLLIMREQAHS